uniref:DNA-directed RNA polymerase n=1 Tax=Stigeoclonium sp. FACHB-2430 TaxID=2725788 RepID=A0A6H1U5A4_9CHLO|nr:beta subunit of RNA polymerase [Stigeoclonium sp. FACHB-2430]
MLHRPVVKEGEWVQAGDLLSDCASSIGGEFSIGQNILIAYLPWEGYNYEDAILISERLVYEDLYTSIHIERYDISTEKNPYGIEKITKDIVLLKDTTELNHLDKNGIAQLGAWLKEGDILVGKITPTESKKEVARYVQLYNDILGKKVNYAIRDSSLRVPRGLEAKVIRSRFDKKRDASNSLKSSCISSVHIYLAEKRKVQVGDKMAGRHGNKGIISQILPRQDMPYLPDGTPIDMALNPLGVPSRMNVGQIYECLLGLAGKHLGEQYRIQPFDEAFGPEASRSFVFSKLYSAKTKTGQSWLFQPTNPGKLKLFDGRTGNCFDQAITTGYSYMIKLVHLVDEKIHCLTVGPYSLITQQPLKGRSKHGGQRLGEMEVWAIEAYGAAFTLLELLTIKSDDVTGRLTIWDYVLYKKPLYIGTPASFKVLICELQALCLDIGIYKADKSNILKQINVSSMG